MLKDTEVEIIYSDLKKVIGEKYEKMKGFPITQGREIDIVDYLDMLFFKNIDYNISLKDIITEMELEPLKHDVEILQLFNRIRILRK